MKVHPWAAATAAFAAGSIAAVGIAQATSAPTKIPDSTTGVITACMVKKTGAVRFINAQVGKMCTSKEKKVTFTKTGPTGATGATGAQGVQGPIGPSSAIVKVNAAAVNIDDLLIMPGQPPKNRVVEMTLAPGSYTLMGTTSIKTTNATTNYAACSLMATSGTVSASPAVFTYEANGQWAPFTVTGTYTNTAEATVYVRCTPSAAGLFDGRGASNGATLTATKVGEVTVQ